MPIATTTAFLSTINCWVSCLRFYDGHPFWRYETYLIGHGDDNLWRFGDIMLVFANTESVLIIAKTQEEIFNLGEDYITSNAKLKNKKLELNNKNG